MSENGNGYSLDKRWIEGRLNRLEQSVDGLTEKVSDLRTTVEAQKTGISVVSTVGITVLTAVLSCGGTWMVAKWQLGSEAEQARQALYEILKEKGLEPAGDHR